MALRIRASQFRAIERAMGLEELVGDLLLHLPAFAPYDWDRLGHRGVLPVINLGIFRGEAHGLTNPGLLHFYIELMFMFGSDFDTDPALPWAAEALLDRTTTDPERRAQLLHARMVEYLDTVAGGARRTRDTIALRSLRGSVIEQLSPEDPDFVGAMVKAFFAIHPTRSFYVGEPVLRGLVHAATTGARLHGIGTGYGVSLFALMMFSLGHGFATDPRFPWVADSVAPSTRDGSTSREQRLEAALAEYIRSLLSYFEEG